MDDDVLGWMDLKRFGGFGGFGEKTGRYWNEVFSDTSKS